MIKLSDVRDYIESLKIADNVYSGKMDSKDDKSFGVYHSKHTHAYRTAIGGPSMQSYGTKYVTFLIHWNKSQRETEDAAIKLFKSLESTREVDINEKRIKFIQLLVNEPVDVGTDDAGIYEMVIEAAVIYQKQEVR